MDISKPVVRVDAEEKISGRAKYVCDMEFDNMLYAKTFRSTKARAKILDIIIPTLPEGYFIIDKNDVIGNNKVKIIIEDQPFFADGIVNYIGEPILLVVGEDKEKILEIMSRIEVEYEDLTPVFDMEAAERNTSQPIYGEDNCFAKYTYSKGDIEKVKLEAKIVIENEYKTGYQEHIYLETQGVIALCEDKRIKVLGSMQCPYFVKEAVVAALNFEEDRVQVIQTVTGGAFGGKEEFPSLIAGQAAIAAYKIGRPIKLIYDRNEDIECTTKRHPSLIKLKTYVDENNKILGLEADVKLDGGAYSGMSTVVLQRSMFAITGVYNIENVSVKGKVLSTNNVVSGAYRGFGAPQSFFALEMHMDYMAKKLSIDRIDFRKNNLLKKGDLSSTAGKHRDYIPLPELMEKVEAMADYNSIKDKQASASDVLPGIGYALFFHGGGFTGNGERDHIKAKVKLKKNKDGFVEILIANIDMGQGAQTALRKIVSVSLGIPFDKIIYDNPDTDKVVNSGPTVASRTTMIVGRLLEKAAIEMKERWTEEEFEIITQYKHPEGFEWDNDNFIGDVYNAYSWGANIVEVEVNKITLEVEVKGVWVAFDIGKVIDERLMKGQVDGGILQGLGYAGMEVMEVKEGRLMQRTNTDYVIPTALDFPRIECAFVDNPYIEGPFGAKSAGELTFIGAPVAYAMAIQNAIGKDINTLPVTPEYLMEVMQDER